MANLPPLSPALKALQPYVRTALEHDNRDPVIAYWCRMYALQTGLTIDKKGKESLSFLMACMDWLEQFKKSQKENEAISNETVAQAHVENYAIKMFLWADAEDRNVVKAFYTSGIVFDTLTTFGDLTEEVQEQRKYAKWKATYIHNCLKTGIIPKAGPEASEEEEGNTPQDYAQHFDTGRNANHSSLPYPDSGSAGEQSGGQRSAYGADPSTSSTLGVPVPGAQAPPSTPSGSNQPSPSSGRSTFQMQATNGSALSADEIQKAQKYCKWAGSALQYEDVPTAVDNLRKALLLLTAGKE